MMPGWCCRTWSRSSHRCKGSRTAGNNRLQIGERGKPWVGTATENHPRFQKASMWRGINAFFWGVAILRTFELVQICRTNVFADAAIAALPLNKLWPCCIAVVLGLRRYAAHEPHKHPLPEPWQQRLAGSFQQVLLVHSLRQEWFVPAAHQYVSEHLGPQFTEPEPWSLDGVFAETSSQTPIIFILSTGEWQRMPYHLL